MSYQISKYDAIKAVLRAEESNNNKLAARMMQVISRAARKEIERNIYSKVYIIEERDKKLFENSIKLVKSVSDNE